MPKNDDSKTHPKFQETTTSPRSLAPGTRSGSVGPARGHRDPPVGTCPLHLSMATYDCQQQLFPMSPQLFCWSVAPRPIALAWQTRQSKRRNQFCKVTANRRIARFTVGDGRSRTPFTKPLLTNLDLGCSSPVVGLASAGIRS